VPDLRLRGCRSRPLLGYLKALGVLRVVAGQADAGARGRWRAGVFELRSALDYEQLAQFLLHEYAPAPVVSPWNGGSGFHPKDDRDAIVALERSNDERFAAYRTTIAAARTALTRRGLTDKPAAGEKLPLVRELRRAVPDEALPWLDAAVVVVGDVAAYPPLLGSGGNDGRYDFSNNYAQAVVRCVASGDPAYSRAALSAALDGDPIELQRKLSLGHLNRDVSPTNSPTGQSDSLGNPWDLILAVEGTLLLVAGAARRHGAATGGALVAPFTARATAAGYGSAAAGESGRAELWLPLWSRWASHAEIVSLARESRAEVGTAQGSRPATTGLDFARAAGELGVARGIDAFERYAILERAGQSSLAVPAGRVSVAARPGAAALRSIDPWLTRLLSLAGGDRLPRGMRSVIRQLERASFELASKEGSAAACAVLEAMGAVEHAIARSRAAIATEIRPAYGGPAQPWLEVADDDSPEFAVAVSLSSLRDRKRTSPGLRDYLHGTRDAGRAFDPEQRHAIDAGGPDHLLAAVHARRHLDAARARTAAGGLPFDDGVWCDPDAARLFAAGELDDDRVLRLARGLALLDYRAEARLRPRTGIEARPQPAYELLALAWMGRARRTPHDDEREALGPRPGWAARLAAGATREVVSDALLRLRLAGLPPIPNADDLHAASPSGVRLGAALLIPLGPLDVRSIGRRMTIPDDDVTHHDGTEDTA
jgi:CRISPR-associated protein Csx17